MEQEIKIKVDFHLGAKVEIVGFPDKEYPEHYNSYQWQYLPRLPQIDQVP